MATTLYGFRCVPCGILAWPDVEACPECGGETDAMEIAVPLGLARRARAVVEEARPEEVYLTLHGEERTS